MVGQQLDKEKKEVLEKIKQKKEDCFGIIADHGFEITCCKSWVLSRLDPCHLNYPNAVLKLKIGRHDFGFISFLLSQLCCRVKFLERKRRRQKLRARTGVNTSQLQYG